MKKIKRDEYAAFQSKIMRRFCGNIIISILIVLGVYQFLWKGRIGDWIVWLLGKVLDNKHEAFAIYHNYFRGNKEIFFVVTIIFIFAIMLWQLFRWITKYFKEINSGIDALLTEDTEKIRFSKEMLPFEIKLNVVKQTLNKQKADAAYAEQRKDELVMYLAHDIRTPLTSVLGYLELLEKEPEMSIEQRSGYVHIALDKANRLEKMINEFFEITRYNSGQVTLSKVPIDLYYMLVQLSDELSPLFSNRGNSVILNIDENITIYADADKIARVFSNILKNAAAYSYPKTEIVISAEVKENQIALFFCNKGKTISVDDLDKLFDKFYRSDKSRRTDTGGTGLGLAIAKEIVLLHNGEIYAESKNDTITFCVRLPMSD